MMTRRSALLLVAAAWACSRPTEVEGTPRPAVTEANVAFSDLLEIRAARDTLDLVNKTRHVVYYFLSEREGVVLVVPTAPCDDPARCPGVTARDQFRIAYARPSCACAEGAPPRYAGASARPGRGRAVPAMRAQRGDQRRG